MTERRFYVRKLVYLAVIVVLILPISWLSMPARGTHAGVQVDQSTGGVLAQMRQEYGLSHGSLGNIDPTSQTVRLASLGFRGVACTFLWSKANEYKKKEDWSNMMATVDTLTRLQPHFIAVWRFQAWNVAYNVSVEWDDYRDRYHWVMRGITFLQRGTEINNDDPSLLGDTGWFISHKIGRSDEAEYFREMFKNDPDFHPPSRPYKERDNWLVGKTYYRKAEDVIEKTGRRYRGKSPLIFYSLAPLNNMYYAIALEKDGTLGEAAKIAWMRAHREWAGTDPRDKPFGEHVLLVNDEGTTVEIRLNHYEETAAQAEELRSKLDQLAPGLREKLIAAKKAELTRAERLALETPLEELSDKQHELRYVAELKIRVGDRELAEAMPADVRDEALQLAQQSESLDKRAYWINRYRDTINFNYWRARSRAEQTPDALAARRYLYDATQRLADAELEAARDAYERGLEHWRLVLTNFPLLREDVLTAHDLVTVLKEYRDRVLQQLVRGRAKLPVGYGFVSIEEIKDWPEFCAALQQAGEADSPSVLKRLWGALPESARKKVRQLAETEDASLLLSDKSEILVRLNDLLASREFYQAEDFPGIELNETEQQQVQCFAEGRRDGPCRGLTQSDLRILNRSILEKALPAHIQPREEKFVLAELLERHKSVVAIQNLDVTVETDEPEEAEGDQKSPPEDAAQETAKPEKS